MYTFPIQMVHEKEVKLKYSMYVMGCKVTPYWLGNLLFDITYLILYIVIFIIVGSIMPNITIVKNAIVGWIFLLFSGGLCIICYSYFLSFRYQTQGAIQKYFFWYLLFLFYILPGMLLTLISEDQNKTKFYALHIYFQIFSPIFELGNGISCVIDVYRTDIQPDDVKFDDGTVYYTREGYPEYDKPFKNVY